MAAPKSTSNGAGMHLPKGTDRARREQFLWLAVGAASASGLFFLSHPYWGIVHDGDIYAGQAVAQKDLEGLGRDILFALNGQFGFSIYPKLIGAVFEGLGVDRGALALTVAGLVAWVLALAAFAGTFARGRILWCCIVVAGAVPSFYSHLFRYAEQFPTPRPLAEAAVLAGLAALVAGRSWVALACILSGALIHPLMAAPGLGVWLLVHARLDWRWLAAAMAGFVASLLSSAAGVPAPGGLLRRVDPAWMAGLSANSYLFVSQWGATDWARAAVHAATVLLALPFIARKRARLVLGASLVVGGLGVVVAYLAGDQAGLAMVLQVQPWRALWLVGVAGTLLLPVAFIGLYRGGPRERLVLACLVLGWLSAPVSGAGIGAAAAALLTAFAGPRVAMVPSPRLVLLAWLATGLFGLLAWGQRAFFFAELLASKPQDAPIAGLGWLFWIFSIPVIAGAIGWALCPSARRSLLAGSAATAAVIWAAAATWDDRSRLDRRADLYLPDAELVSLLPAGTGEILWLRNGARFAWKLAGRPNWVSYLQGAAMVFSPELARVWQARMDRLVAANLADSGDRSPLVGQRSLLNPTLDDFDRFCRAPDAPAAIVAPLDGSILLPPGLSYLPYKLPAPHYVAADRGNGVRWYADEDHAVIPCAQPVRSGSLRGTLSG